MAGDWIKMRGALLQSPKLIGMSRHLVESADFREWLTPGGSGPMNGQIVSDGALRCVTCALLLRVWSASREFGKYDGEDLVLSHITLADLDAMAGAPGVGKAMSAVQWAIEGDGVRLPNFKQHNVPMSNAERQRDFRERQNNPLQAVTKPLREPRHNRVTTEEKRREEKKEENPLPPLLDTPEFREAWKSWQTHRREIRKKLTPTTEAKQLKALAAMGLIRAIRCIEHTIEKGWMGLREPDAAFIPVNGKPSLDDLNAQMAAKYGSQAKAGGA